jgi:hypothetical protein
VVFGFKGHNNYATVIDKYDPDISIVSSGPHIDDTGDVNHIMTQIDHHHKTRLKRGLRVPTTIWKTQNPGHWGCQTSKEPLDLGPVEITSELIMTKILKTTCTKGRDKYGWCALVDFDKFAKKVAPTLGFKVLDMSPLYLRPDAHVLGKKEDCLHFCQPGPLNVFSIFLLQMLYNKEV